MKKLNLEAFQAKLNEQEQAKIDALCGQLLGTNSPNSNGSKAKSRSKGSDSV